MPKQRWKDHLKWNHTNRRKSGWIRGLLEEGLLPILEILEECPFAVWKERELYWQKHYEEAGEPLTNLSVCGAGGKYGPQWNEREWPGFIDPTGQPITIHNLHGYCAEHGLNSGCMKLVYAGKRASHKGYTCKRPEIEELQKERERLLKARIKRVGDLLRGVPRTPEVVAKFTGWKQSEEALEKMRRASKALAQRPDVRAARIEASVKEWDGFVDPQGVRCPPFKNLNEMCRSRGLTQALMLRVYHGDRFQHKGYTCCRPEALEKLRQKDAKGGAHRQGCIAREAAKRAALSEKLSNGGSDTTGTNTD